MQNINISYNNIAFIQNKNDNISNNLKKINLTVQREKSSNSFFEKQKIKNMINNNSNKKNRITPLSISKDLSVYSVQQKKNNNLISNNNITSDIKNENFSMNKDFDLLSEINNITRIKNKNY